MRQIILSVLLFGGLSIANAQMNKEELKTTNTQSPGAESSVTIGGKQIWIYYHAPSVKGRKMFNGAGAQQPDGTVWRMGADYGTVLHTDADLDINGLKVPKGDYVLYADLDQGKWTLIVNKKLMTGGRHIWGINRDGSTTNDSATELGRTAFTMGKPASSVETLKITLSSTGGNSGKLMVEFENVTASVNFKAE